jgi:DNA-binding CsgD family transcriptional regulator
MERQLFPYLCKGLSSKEISAIIHRAPKTVEKYRTQLLEKTGCKNTPNLVFFLTSHNIYPDDPLEK